MLDTLTVFNAVTFDVELSRCLLETCSFSLRLQTNFVAEYSVSFHEMCQQS